MTTPTECVSPAELVSHFRMMAHQYFPYLSPYVYSLVPVERPGLGTMAVDMQGRMYYDPEFAQKLDLNQGAYVVLHEAWHLILRHCHRAEGIIGKTPTPQQHRLYNIAVDCVVWELMEPMAEFAPGRCVTWPKLKERYPALERNMLPGEIYSILSQPDDPAPGQCPNDEQPEHKSDDEDEGEEDEGDESAAGRQEQEQEAGDSPDTDQGTEPDDDSGDSEDGRSQSEDTGGPEEGDRPGGYPGSEGSAEDDGAPSADQVADDGFELIGGGSAADGQPRDYEEEPNPNWDAFVEDQLLEAVERKVAEKEADEEWVNSRGEIPGCLKDTIQRKLRPQPNPWDSLRASVARAVLNPRGAKDFTYQQVNRRQFAMPNAPRLKGSRGYAPKAVVIIDTSGSMTVECKRKCIEVMAQGLRAVGDFQVIFGDVRVHADVRWTRMTDEVSMPGGGGTRMDRLIEYAEQTHKPNVIVIGTDGGTAWPQSPTKAQLIVALTQDMPTPPWATRVRIPDSPGRD